MCFGAAITCGSMFYLTQTFFLCIVKDVSEMSIIIIYGMRELEITISVLCVYLGFVFNQNLYEKICCCCHYAIFKMCYRSSKQHIIFDSVMRSAAPSMVQEETDDIEQNLIKPTN